MSDVLVIGAGNMGRQLARAFKKKGFKIYIHDQNEAKGKELAEKLDGVWAADINKLNEYFLVIMALPANAVVDFTQVINKKLKNTLLLNIATALKISDLKTYISSENHLISLKIIGEAGAMENGSQAFFIIDEGQGRKVSDEFQQRIEMIKTVLSSMGQVICDEEEKYQDINFIAAEQAMICAAQIEKMLKAKNIPSEAILAAITNVGAGTIMQYPYSPPDYFHKLIFAKHEKLFMGE